MTKQEAVKQLSENLKEDEVIFEYDDGWNAKEWHRAKIEDGTYHTLENYTWEGYNTARNRWGSFLYKQEEVKILSTNK